MAPAISEFYVRRRPAATNPRTARATDTVRCPSASGSPPRRRWRRRPDIDMIPRPGRLAQLARAPRLHRGGHRFESCIAHHTIPDMLDRTRRLNCWLLRCSVRGGAALRARRRLTHWFAWLFLSAALHLLPWQALRDVAGVNGTRCTHGFQRVAVPIIAARWTLRFDRRGTRIAMPTKPRGYVKEALTTFAPRDNLFAISASATAVGKRRCRHIFASAIRAG